MNVPIEDNICSHGSRRSPLKGVVDYQGYSFHDKYWYHNTANGDSLSPSQVSSAMMYDFTELLKIMIKSF